MTSPLATNLAAIFASRKGLALVLPAVLLTAGLLVVGAKSHAATVTSPNASGQDAADLSAPLGTLTNSAGNGNKAVPIKIAGNGSSTFSPAQKSAIEKIVKDYLINNPGIMLQVQQALQARSEKQEAQRLKVAIKKNAKELFHRANAAVAGNPKGDVTLVEFFDYNCGFCKRALGNIAHLVATDKKLRVVFKEFPILSRGSEEASRIALAARQQGKYWQIHKALLSAHGHANGKSALKIAARLGLDLDKLKKDMTSPAVVKEISDNHKLAQAMGINGTPHFVIGDKVIPGAPQDLLQEIRSYAADIRKNGCNVC